MSTIEVQPPYPAFAGTDGQPLENGYIWIGTVNLSPQVNPIAVYWDAAQTISAPLPIRTLNGYPSHNGTPARFYVASDYSIQVLDSKGSVVYTSLNDNLSGNGFVASNATGNGSQTVFAVSSIPRAIFINGVYQNQNTYTVASGNVTFSEAPPLNSVIEFLI
ncbi:Bacteriophage P22 tailspike, N-terminal [uncultured Caudovirales phage]|uniref:Bacteriophage P22 tailspike, N-terminal n=1 Tax=uncultured Caudovirales phage TaxID=2100421 RepID=A0A6J5LWA0_9CAUD|nr:Bacteriophage P22 tailspike, N-terminal [uncultured Caudovirales phage]CAB4161025.1 Bacteriophage P22 tailspike, N-terminal [uncultured Caudovirales phage]